MPLDINMLNPYIRVATPSIILPGKIIRRRVIFDYELIYLERGEWTLAYADQEYRCRAGQFLFLRPGIPHSFLDISEEVSQPHIHFDMVYTERSPSTPVSFKDYGAMTAQERAMISDDLFSDYPATPFVSFSDPQTLPLFYAITTDMHLSPLTRKAKLTQLIGMLIADNFPAVLHTPPSQHTIAQQLKDYIDAGQGLTSQLCDLEKQFSYSKYHLERQFKQRFGMSLTAYRNEQRLQRAVILLQTHSVSAVAVMLGFSSIYAFSRAFRQRFGTAPSKYNSRE